MHEELQIIEAVLRLQAAPLRQSIEGHSIRPHNLYNVTYRWNNGLSEGQKYQDADSKKPAPVPEDPKPLPGPESIWMSR
jgi:hypothetical protein